MLASAHILCALLAAFQATTGTLGDACPGSRVRGVDLLLEAEPGRRGEPSPRRHWALPFTYGETVVDRANQYNGRVYDPGTGFHDYGARLYWPQIGRFISADSVTGSPASPMTLNRYSYVLNNPYKYVDPDGHQPRRLGLPPSQFLAQQRLARFNSAAEELQQRDPITRRDYIAPKGWTPTWDDVYRIEAQVNTLRAAQGADLGRAPIDRRSWKSERQALWKMEARLHPERYSREQLEQMERGETPTGSDGKPMEWHHDGRRPESPKQPMTRTEHRIGPNFKKNHDK